MNYRAAPAEKSIPHVSREQLGFARPFKKAAKTCPNYVLLAQAAARNLMMKVNDPRGAVC
jgi:hypothetical protein